jgi:hypothetical protein
MELLDRYLEAVKKHLPWQRQDDILAELKANLEAQLEDKEAELGRPLTPGEAEDWLKQLGHPIQVAARYQPQRSLIGPSLFPYYWYVMKVALIVTAIVYVIATVVQIATQTPAEMNVLAVLLRLPDGLMRTAAWVTLVFALIEFGAARCPQKFPMLVPPTNHWLPSDLPSFMQRHGGGKKPRSFAHAVTEVIFGILFLLWWLLLPQHPYLLIGPAAFHMQSWSQFASPFQLAPAWVQFYWWVVGVNALQLAWRIAALIRGDWQRQRRAQNIVISAIGLIPVWLLLTVPNHAYLTLQHPALDMAHYCAAMNAINQLIHWNVLGIGIFICLILAWEIGRSGVNAYRKRAAAMR